MVISLKFGQKVSYFLSNSSVENALNKTKQWARNFTPPPSNQTRRVAAMAKNPDKVPLCHQYWANLQARGDLKSYPHRIVEQHGKFNTFNGVLVKGRAGCWDFDMIKDIVKESDIHFKRLKPTKQPVTVFRCVGEKLPFLTEDVKYYNKAFMSKKGDKIIMPEYAYAAGGTEYSNVYKGYEGRGITYEIDVPAGARVSHSGDIIDGKLDHWSAECVFPRGSQFEVIESKVLEDGSAYKKLKYILPDEPWRNV